MKKTILLFIGLFLVFPVFAQYTVRGGTGDPLPAEENTFNRIQVYLLNGLSGAEISFTSDSGAHQWYKYDNRAGDAVAIPCRQTGNTSTITNLSDGFGYFVGEDQSAPSPFDANSTSYVWIIDYSKHLPTIFSFNIQEDEYKCESLKLIADVEAAPLEYRTYSGAPVTMQRTFHLLYSDLEWTEESKMFAPVDAILDIEGLISEISIDAPLTNTTFTLTGDDYAEHFGLEQKVSTPEYEAVAVEAHGIATSLKEAGVSEQSAGGKDTDYSAPVEINLEAFANEPVAAMYIWRIMKIDPVTRDSIDIVRYPEKSISYKFEEAGNYVAQLEVTDRLSICLDNSQVIPIFIGDSDLRLPNAFSPGSSPGSNDEYRVSYKSLVSFKASIYNRWGNLLFHWEDPAQGWDGKVGGKYVPTGVYFIVVEAQGADGKHYTRSSDINILRSKNN
jgi:gliding motility-associated-like protein